jgi:hypothetical protein
MKKEKKKKPKGTASARAAIRATLFIDPVCPWGYSAGPALRTIEWRYRDQIAWEMVLIGLSSPGGPPPPGEPAAWCSPDGCPAAAPRSATAGDGLTADAVAAAVGSINR